MYTSKLRQETLYYDQVCKIVSSVRGNLVGLRKELYHVYDGTSLSGAGLEKSQSLGTSEGRRRKMDHKGTMMGVEFKHRTAATLCNTGA